MSRHPLPDAALGAHVAIVGKTGSGKTYAAKGIVERLLTEGRRVCVIDPTGAWWGLRSSADGKHAGFPVAVFGGEHADVPIVAGSGAALAGLIAKQNMPAVIDVSEFLIGERHRFMEDFAAALYRDNRAPLHLVIDEADDFAPQNPLPESKRMLHRVDQIVRRGRIRGFRVMLITQRPAVLHKNVLTQANTLIAMRLVSPQDRKAIEDWIKGQADLQQGKDVLNTLARLQLGEGWIWAPELDVLERAAFPKIKTFDSSRTPEDGEEIPAPTRLADVDLNAIRGSLDAAVEEAKANDPKALRARIAELERQSRSSAAPAIDPAALVEAETRGYQRGIQRAQLDMNSIRGHIIQAEAMLQNARGMCETERTTVTAAPARVSTPRPAPAPRVANGPGDASIGNSGLRRILIALAQRPQGLNHRQLGVRAGLSSRSGTFATYLSKGRSNGWIEGSGDLRITDAGLQALGSYEPLPEGRALLDHWLGELGSSGAARILRALADAYPRALAHPELGEAAGLSERSGTFATYLSKLRTLELITGRGELRASEELFS